MTVCIAAFCDKGQTLILATDKELGLDFTSAEFAVGKTARIHPHWFGLYAGNVDPVPEILEPVRLAFIGQEKTTTTQMVDAVTASFRTVRLAKAEAIHLSSRGWTIEEFKERGRESFPEFLFREIDSEIAGHYLGMQILLAGFGEDGGILATVRDPGISNQKDLTGFHAIGSGDNAAMSSLFDRAPHINMALEEVLYYVYEAKVAAERAVGVGFETDLFVMRKGGELVTISEASIKALESQRLHLSRRDLTPHQLVKLKSKMPELVQ